MNVKPYLRVMVKEGMAMITKFLHLYSIDATTILSPFSPYDSLLMPSMWISAGEKKSSMNVTAFFLVYMDRLVCSNSDKNKEDIRDQYQLGSDGGAITEHLEIGRNCEKYSVMAVPRKRFKHYRFFLHGVHM